MGKALKAKLWTLFSMAKTRAVKFSMKVKCDCGKDFIAEDCEPICPYCNRKYQVSILAAPKKMKAVISPLSKHSTKSETTIRDTENMVDYKWEDQETQTH